MDIEVLVITITAIVCVGVLMLGERLYKKVIVNKVEELGGRLIFCKRKFGFREFGFAAMSTSIFFFEYILDDEIKEGWASFGAFFPDDWRL